MRKIVTDLDIRGNLTVGGLPVSGGSGGSVPSYSVDLGAVTANTPVVVAHDLGTFDVIVSIVEKDTAATGGGTGEAIVSTITIDTINQISITFAADAVADLYRVVVIAAVGSVANLVPAGGATNQILAKATDTDYDTAWVEPAGGTVVTNEFDNAAFELWQKGVGPTTATLSENNYFVDRWFVKPEGASVTQEQSTSVPTGSPTRYSLKVNGAVGTTTVDVVQRVLAERTPQLSTTVTFSCKIYNGTGTAFTPSLLIGTPTVKDDFTVVDNRLTQVLQSCVDASWTTVTHSVDISGYVNLANGIEFAIRTPSGAVVDAQSFNVSEPQLTATVSAVDFVKPNLNQDKMECLRHHFRRSHDGSKTVMWMTGISSSTTNIYAFGGMPFPVPMLKSPVVNTSGISVFQSGYGYYAVNNQVDGVNGYGDNLAFSSTFGGSGWGSGRLSFMCFTTGVPAYLDFDANL